jgi:hypothetical protein
VPFGIFSPPDQCYGTTIRDSQAGLSVSATKNKGRSIVRHRSLPIVILAITCGLLADAPPVRAAAVTWVSGTGTNAGSCAITAPCKTFQFAYGQTSANGVINVLSAGNLGR